MEYVWKALIILMLVYGSASSRVQGKSQKIKSNPHELLRKWQLLSDPFRGLERNPSYFQSARPMPTLKKRQQLISNSLLRHLARLPDLAAFFHGPAPKSGGHVHTGKTDGDFYQHEPGTKMGPVKTKVEDDTLINDEPQVVKDPSGASPLKGNVRPLSPRQKQRDGVANTAKLLDSSQDDGDDSDNESVKQGSFKIDDGAVKGFGTYQIKGEEVEVDINIKIFPVESQPSPTSNTSTTAKPSGGETPTAPAGPEESRPSSTSNTTNTTKPSGGETPADMAAFAEEGLKAHNDYRARHNAKPLKLDDKLSKSAYEWAKYLSDNDVFEHSPSNKRENQGENIAAWCDAKGQTAAEVSKRWYNEVCDGYDFTRNDMDWNAGHFTAMVWRESTDFGLGFYDKKRDDGWVCRTMVARYSPPGNGGGRFVENVKEGSFDKTKHCETKASKRR